MLILLRERKLELFDVLCILRNIFHSMNSTRSAKELPATGELIAVLFVVAVNESKINVLQKLKTIELQQL